MATYIKLQWWNDCDLGNIYYSGGFRNKLFLDAAVGAPEYESEEEGTYNSAGEFITTFQRLVKVYKINVIVPEYIADSLKAMALTNNIYIYTTDGLYGSQIKHVQVESEPVSETNDCMQNVTIRFRQDDQIESGNCCVNMS